MTARALRCKTALEILGVRVVLETALPDVALAVASRLPPMPVPSGGRGHARRYAVGIADGPDGGFRVHRGARAPVSVVSVEAAADLVVDDLQRTVAQCADGLVLVHAGAVAWQGRALVLPGRSRTGKSELVRALVGAGAEYLSDEFAVFDGDGLVHPYARPIALRQGDGTRRWVPAEMLGARTAAGPVPPALIAFLRFSPAARWRPRRLSAGQTVLGLLRHSVAARRRLPLVRSVLVPVASSVEAFSGVRGEASEVAGRLLRELASAPSR